jgi:hypothetical protein
MADSAALTWNPMNVYADRRRNLWIEPRIAGTSRAQTPLAVVSGRSVRDGEENFREKA